MEQNEREIIFQSSDEALQMLAEVTGKKIMIPDKAEPTVASQADANQINNEIGDEEDNESEIAEDADPVKSIDKKIEGLTKVKTQVQTQVQDAMKQVQDITKTM